LNLPSVLDCLPSIVRKFWFAPSIAWKYFKASGQEFFSHREMGRSVSSSRVQKILQGGCDCHLYPLFVDSYHGHVISANLGILSRPSLNELFSRGTNFRRSFLSDLSIEEAFKKGVNKFVNK
jgi:hypothetical protein